MLSLLVLDADEVDELDELELLLELELEPELELVPERLESRLDVAGETPLMLILTS